jgi:hypothetical protein
LSRFRYLFNLFDVIGFGRNRFMEIDKRPVGNLDI